MAKLACLLCVMARGGGAAAPANTGPKPTEDHAGSAAAPVDAEAAKQASIDFIHQLDATKPNIQGCYESAMKADASLQKTVELSISAKFTDGKAATIASSPSLGAAFDGCLKTVALSPTP